MVGPETTLCRDLNTRSDQMFLETGQGSGNRERLTNAARLAQACEATVREVR
jgi:hypothetical protein